nr:uncharacterized protein I303_03224 [Kwoniella dejecticola CBS 10117]OBR87200.1 hypothetical protein I303_03224 [Kwoniella dejecticola CBS 10117]
MVSSSPSSSGSSLYIFTTSQIPLPIKYAHPRKPVLVVPPIVHRSLHNALDGDTPSVSYAEGELIIPHPDGLVKHDLPPSSSRSNTNPKSDSDSQPSAPSEGQINGEVDGTGLSDAASNYIIDSELTIKLHLVGEAPSSSSPSSASGEQGYISWIKESLGLLEKYKGLSKDKIDTLLIGFKGIDYRGAKTAASEMFGCGSEGLETPNTQSIPSELRQTAIRTLRQVKHQGDILGEQTKLGSLYFTLDLLKELGQGVQVNALDTPDCHHLPKEYTSYAREAGVQLWAGGGGEGSDPLPTAHLHNLLQEFSGNLSDLTDGEVKSPALGQPIGVRADGLKFQEDAEKGVEVKWVLSYTLVSKTRNVVKDKG